ncbi:MAG: DUF4783 domain-containing protein [Bernardetiaceae bacterium]|nr:DUF4783 domain-containing protein [Bernardetiaceae bacterium]
MKHNILLFYLFFASLFFLSSASPQIALQSEEQLTANIQTALQSGSSKELIKYLSNPVELNFGKQKASYSRAQAEFVLKDFFTKNPPNSFSYIYKGGSRDGLRYVIGKYMYAGGSYRVYILIKDSSGKHYVDTLNFSKE